MASIIVSFVGRQDPYSDNTTTEGSIVTLVRHLLQEQCLIRRVILLHTADTEMEARDTKDWLMMAPLELDAGPILCETAKPIAFLPVDPLLSDDPVNLLLAVQAARQGIDAALLDWVEGDRLELNASSGTPVMKSAWSILQAAGYALHSRVWQVRNPKEMQLGQQRVFQTNVDTLKQEFDLKVVKRQVNDYNYSGALDTAMAVGLDDEAVVALLNYAHCRFALDFDRAYSAIAPLVGSLDGRWNQEISQLRSQSDRRALLREAYFNGLIEYRNRQYADFLVKLSRFQEGVLSYLVSRLLERKLPATYSECAGFWQFVQQFDQGKLDAFLQAYRFRGTPLTLQRFPNRPVLTAMLEYHPQFAEVLNPIAALSAACDRRNKVIHNFEGISQIEDADYLLQQMRQILKKIAPGNLENPFDRLNQQICTLLDLSVRSATIAKS